MQDTNLVQTHGLLAAPLFCVRMCSAKAHEIKVLQIIDAFNRGEFAMDKGLAAKLKTSKITATTCAILQSGIQSSAES